MACSQLVGFFHYFPFFQDIIFILLRQQPRGIKAIVFYCLSQYGKRGNAPIGRIKLPHFSLTLAQSSHHTHSSISKYYQWNVQHQLSQSLVPKSIIGQGCRIIMIGQTKRVLPLKQVSIPKIILLHRRIGLRMEGINTYYECLNLFFSEDFQESLKIFKQTGCSIRYAIEQEHQILGVNNLWQSKKVHAEDVAFIKS